MTMTSMAPLSVAGLIEFHVFETEPLRLRTYCILPVGSSTLGDKFRYPSPENQKRMERVRDKADQ